MPHRILFATTTSDFGGAEVFLQELIGRLDRRRFEPLLLSLCPPGRMAERVRADGVPVHTFDSAESTSIPELLRSIGRLRRFFARERVDLVQSQLYRANVVANVAGRLATRRPVVVNAQHSLYAMTGKSAEMMARWARPLADVTVAVSPIVEEYLVRDEKANPKRIRVIDNGVDDERFRPSDDRPLRSELGLEDDVLLLGAVGRLSEEKGIEHLLDALGRYEEASGSAQAAHLALVGDGPERGALEERVATLELVDRVSFLGVRSDIPELMRSFDVYVLPSLREALPISLLEAMASGACVVASAVGGVPHALEDGVEGLIVEPGDVDALAAALRQCLGDSVRRAGFGTAARARVERDFSLTVATRRYETLYAELLSARA
ncbi:MAG: glycosyltransferase [Acidobacteriota bacterium]